jgi:hypothetical protein
MVTSEERDMGMYVEERVGFSLDARDRCDRCSARAAVVTVMRGGGTLLWCAHHYGDNEAALVNGGAVVVNDTRPSS